MTAGGDILIGIDAGTSVVKSVAFDMLGAQVGAAARPNRYATRPDGAAVQSMEGTWEDCAATLRALGEAVPNLARRCAAIAVTAQGDGTWLVGPGDEAVTEAWLWLDARAAPVVDRLRGTPADRERFAVSGAGLNACQMSAQLLHMKSIMPQAVEAAETAMHAKDWLYLNLTGVRATDPTEGGFTFGDFRTRAYDDRVIEALGLGAERRLLPPILDGSRETHPLMDGAAARTGLRAGTPVSLGFVDVVCTALGGGIRTGGEGAGCTILGSTGMHMRAVDQDEVVLGDDLTGYVMPLPIPRMVAQIQSNMAATLNLDWLMDVAADLLGEFGDAPPRSELVARIDPWLKAAAPGRVLYHPYISAAGERGPFVNPAARAGFAGLSSVHRFPNLVRAVAEGLGLAGHDCYEAMGGVPPEVRLTGGAARSPALRGILGAALGVPVRPSRREEAGAAGAAMMAAVAIGAYPDMDSCIADWVAPTLGPAEHPDEELARRYADLLGPYRAVREAMPPVWAALANGGAAA